MKTHACNRLKFCLGVSLAAIMLLTFGAAPAQADPADKYKDHPGYVDFESLGGFNDMETSIEVFLKGSLIVIAREALRAEEPELADILDNIQMVRVNAFPLDDAQSEAVAKKIEDLAAKLEKKGWEIAVRVREEDENVHIYTLPGPDDSINGLVVMVVELDDGRHHSDEPRFIFVNIVGTINPEDIGRLGRAIDIDGVDLDHIYDKDGHRSRKHQ